MNAFVRMCATGSIIASVLNAAPFLAVGDSAELFVIGTVEIRADDNIFLAPNGSSDLILSLRPGLELNYGKGSLTKGYVRVGVDVTRFEDHDALDSTLPSASLVTNYDDGKLSLNLNGNYTELNQNTIDAKNVDSFVRRNVLNLSARAESSVTAKSSLSGGLAFHRTDYVSPGFSDLETITVPVNYYYKYSPKLDLSLGYQFRDNESQLGLDSKDNFFNVGLRGELTPKLLAEVRVGVTRRSVAGSGNDSSILGLDSALSYEVTPKTSIRLAVSNDFTNSSLGGGVRDFSINSAVLSRLSEVLAVRVTATYRSLNYYNFSRSDDYFEGQIGLEYAINAHMGLSAAYAYRDNSSTFAGANFKNNLVSLGANFRY